MDSARLAQSFNRVGQHLTGAGHRIVIRRARELVASGALGAAERFLDDAAQRLGDAPLQELHAAFSRWRAGRPAADELCGLPAWQDGAAAEDRVSALISAATAGDLPALLAERVAQQQALERGEALAPPASPAAPTPGRHAIASLRAEPARPSEAIIEAPSQLTARALNLDEDSGDLGARVDDFGITSPLDLPPVALQPDEVDPLAATEVLPDDTAALVRAATRTPPPPPRAPEPDPFAAPSAPSTQGSGDMLILPDDDGVGGFAHIPELHPPTGVTAPISTASGSAGQGSAGQGSAGQPATPSRQPLLLIALAVAALGGAAAWFFTR